MRDSCSSDEFDLCCEQFETAWKSGDRPEIENALNRVPEPRRSDLLVELVQIELWCRCKEVPTPTISEYKSRFPRQGGAIEKAFSEFASKTIDQVSERTIDSDSATRLPDDTWMPASSVATYIPSEESNSLRTTAADDHARYFGEYELLDEIARGGMGVVFKARQVKLNRIVALKMILSGQLAGDNEIKRFQSEAESAGQLDHPGIVPIYEIGQYREQHYFSMGFVDGESLQQKLGKGPLPPRSAAEICHKVAGAVAYAHGKGVIHRDLKPANILIDADGEPKVTDFGLAKRVEAGSTLTQEGDIMGTPSFMPPEQATGKVDEVGPRADVYSLGAVLYALISGRPPFHSASLVDTIRQVIEREPVSPKTLNPAIPSDLVTICAKCLEKDPSHRYSTAADLGDDLHRYLQGFPIRARPVSFVEKTVRWCRRNPAITGALAAVFLIAMSSAAVIWTKSKSESRALEKAEHQRVARFESAEKRLISEIENAELAASLSHQSLDRQRVGKDADALHEALADYEQALQECELLLGVDQQIRMAQASYHVAQATRLTGDFDRSETSFSAAIQQFHDLARSHVGNPQYCTMKGKSLDYLGELYREHSFNEVAEVNYRESTTVLSRCLSENPTSGDCKMELARAHNNFGILLQETGRSVEAHERFADSERMLRELLQRYPENQHYRRDLARTLINIGWWKRIAKQYENAKTDYLSAIAQYDQLLQESPESVRYKFLSATTKNNLGYMLAAYMSDGKSAERWLLEARDQFRTLPRANVWQYQLNYAMCLTNLGFLYFIHGSQLVNDDQIDVAAEYYSNAQKQLQTLVNQLHDHAESKSWLGLVHGALASIADRRGHYGSFSEHLRQAIDHQSDAHRKQPENQTYAARLRGHHWFFTERILTNYLTTDSARRKELALDHLATAIDLGLELDVERDLFDTIRDSTRFQELAHAVKPPR